MYCVEALLKNKKYFDYLKANRRILTDSQFEEIRGASASGYEAVCKLHRSVLAKLEGEFDDLDKPSAQGFDMAKLEAMKEKTNKNFFEDMNKIKAGKGTTAKTVKTTGNDDDILGLGVGGQPTAKAPVAKTGNGDLMDLGNDMLGLDFGTKPAQAQPVAQKKDDLFDLGFGAPQATVHSSKPAPQNNNLGDFDILDLNPKSNAPSMPVTTKHPPMDPLFNFGGPAPTSAPKPVPATNFLGTDDFMIYAKKDSSKPKQSSGGDPFNFIVF